MPDHSTLRSSVQSNVLRSSLATGLTLESLFNDFGKVSISLI